MVKAGGISAFGMVALWIIGAFLGARAGGPILNLLALALLVVVLIALHVHLQRNNFREASGYIWAILGLVVIIALIMLAFATGVLRIAGGAASPMRMIARVGAWALVPALLAIGLQICILLLGIKLRAFGAAAGSSLWRGAGTTAVVAAALLLSGIVLYVLAALARARGLGLPATIVVGLGGVTSLAFWILLGIGLIKDERRGPALGRV